MRDDAGRVLLLTGGIGGAKLGYGFSKIYRSDLLSFIVNTGDDFDYFGLRICPDIDTLLYTLSGRSDQSRGWGFAKETWNALNALKNLGCDTWFSLGDNDLATHIFRTEQMSNGYSLSEVTLDLANRFSINSLIMPMTDTRVATILDTDEGELDFQDYFVRRECNPVVQRISFSNIKESKPSSFIRNYFLKNPPELIVICPSNPFLSIDPILKIPGLCNLIIKSGAPVLAVSPIVDGEALKGPAGKISRELNLSCSAVAVANYYAEMYPGLISTYVIDKSDIALVNSFGDAGLDVFVTDTVMTSESTKKALASSLLEYFL